MKTFLKRLGKAFLDSLTVSIEEIEEGEPYYIRPINNDRPKIYCHQCGATFRNVDDLQVHYHNDHRNG